MPTADSLRRRQHVARRHVEHAERRVGDEADLDAFLAEHDQPPEIAETALGESEQPPEVDDDHELAAEIGDPEDVARHARDPSVLEPRDLADEAHLDAITLVVKRERRELQHVLPLATAGRSASRLARASRIASPAPALASMPLRSRCARVRAVANCRPIDGPALHRHACQRRRAASAKRATSRRRPAAPARRRRVRPRFGRVPVRTTRSRDRRFARERLREVSDRERAIEAGARLIDASVIGAAGIEQHRAQQVQLEDSGWPSTALG